MIINAKVYECDICGKKELVEEGDKPYNIVSFEIYDLKPCICKRCLNLAVEAASDEKVREE